MNSDCIVIMGSNMAEAHPVAFYWPMQAKKKGAVTIHVDPRYTRTSAACDHHVHIRPGTDIAFLSGIIRYILKNELWFKEYVLAFTNASTIINPKFRFDDVTGLFNGWDPEKRSYSEEVDSWDYVYETGPDGKRGEPKRDDTAGSALRDAAASSAGRKIHSGNGLERSAAAVHVMWSKSQSSWQGIPVGIKQLLFVMRPDLLSIRVERRLSEPARSFSCCWAISAVRAAESWP